MVLTAQISHKKILPSVCFIQNSSSLILWSLSFFSVFDMDPLDRCLRAERCCCCASLRVGGIILGFLGLFYAVNGILLYIIRPEAMEEYYMKTHTAPESALASSGMYTSVQCSSKVYTTNYTQSEIKLKLRPVLVDANFSTIFDGFCILNKHNLIPRIV